MKRQCLLVVLAVVMLMVVGCAGPGSHDPEPDCDCATELTARQEAKLSPDLLPAMEMEGSIDLLVQVDPQVVFYQQVDAALAHEMMADPGVIWKARQDGAVIWKLTPEQAVIWKMTTNKAVIWKLTQELIAQGWPIEESYESIHTFKLHGSVGAILELARMEEIAYITPDRTVTASTINQWNGTVGMDMVNTRINNKSFSGYAGEGIGIAVIDSGIKKFHGDFSGASGNRVILRKNFSSELNVYDNYGHGNHITGLIGGNGMRSYDDTYDVYFEGVAPEANLFVAKVLDEDGAGKTSSVINALDWVLEKKDAYKIRVVNISLGYPPVDPWQQDPLCQAVENAISEGLVVVVAAGNYGYYSGQKTYESISSPGIAPHAITVGASNYRSTTRRQQDVNDHNDFVAIFSSRGPTAWDGLSKPDLVAPGVDLVGPYVPGTTIGTLYPNNIVDACDVGGSICGAQYAYYFLGSGTSTATAMVSGAAALVLEAYPGLSPFAVKDLLMISAQVLLDEDSLSSCYTNHDWRSDANCIAQYRIEQGFGLLNMPGAIDLALEMLTMDIEDPYDVWYYNPNYPAETDFDSTDETVIWAQGIAWTDGYFNGTKFWNIYQEPYTSGTIFSTGYNE